MEQCAADVIAVAIPPTHRIGGRHDVAAIVINQVAEEGTGFDPRLASYRAIVRKPGLDRVPERLVHDGLVLARLGDALFDDFAPIDSLLQKMVERFAPERASGRHPGTADEHAQEASGVVPIARCLALPGTFCQSLAY
jgi:hypothetical protein